VEPDLVRPPRPGPRLDEVVLAQALEDGEVRARLGTPGSSAARPARGFAIRSSQRCSRGRSRAAVKKT
jgi:hypothetical protein